jgi:hypothetical protein
LIGECDEADLSERESELHLEVRIDRREQRLQHVIEQMTEADRDEDGEDGVVALDPMGRHERVGEDLLGGSFHAQDVVIFTMHTCT